MYEEYSLIGNVLHKNGKPVTSKGIPLTVNGYMIMPDKTVKPVEELTYEEKRDWQRRASRRLSSVMGECYRNLPNGNELLAEMEEVPFEQKIDFYELCPEYLEHCTDPEILKHFGKKPKST